MTHKSLSQHLVARPVQRTVSWIRSTSLNRDMLSQWWHEHGLALLFYALLSVALSWPMARYFTTHIVGGGYDALHNVWALWHTQQAFLGNQPWFFAPLLYYPEGASLLTHGLGPVTGIFSLPFWPWGAEAAHNGAVLVSLWITGYAMYLLAQGLQFERGVALFAGIMLLSAPMCLAGLQGNITKVFLGGLPLVLLALHFALDLRRSPWWTVAVAPALLIPLLHSGYQFIYAAIGCAFFAVVALFVAQDNRWRIVQRLLLIAIPVLILVGPFLFATISATTADLKVEATWQAALAKHQPDLIQFVLPNYRSVLFGPTSIAIAEQFGVTFSIDKAVTLAWTGLGLILIALLGNRRQSWPWLLFTLVCVVFAMGPVLRVFGQTEFTADNLTIMLPYGVLEQLPGLNFMRFSGRFMMIGYVGFAIAASFGLAWLTRRFPQRKMLIVVGAIGLILLENWPRPMYVSHLPTTPAFYQEIAQDPEEYGVFDIPINPDSVIGSQIITSALYQAHQIVHGKGIAAGYISRTYAEHPRFPYLMRDNADLGQDNLFINDVPAGRVVAQDNLARNNYRYVVWHKYRPGNDGEKVEPARAYLAQLFGAQPPLVDDDMVQVYAVPQTRPNALLESGQNLRRSEEEWRWVASPATLYTTARQPQPALLQITPAAIHDPQAEGGLGEHGTLNVEVGAAFSTSVDLVIDRTTTLPIVLPEGRQTITLTLQAGNFYPATDEAAQDAGLSFAIRSINLLTTEHQRLTDGILINGQAQQTSLADMVALHGEGWYEPAPGAARWAQSPAEFLVYSPADTVVDLSLTPGALYDPESPQGLGTQGVLQITVNDAGTEQLSVRVGQAASLPVALEAGWNRVTLALAAGNFRPSEVQPGNGDQRLLSFALSQIDLE